MPRCQFGQALFANAEAVSSLPASSATCSWVRAWHLATLASSSREALEKVGGFDPDIRLEDVYIELAVTKAGYVIDILGEVLAQYRKHPTNTYKNARFMVDNVFKTYSQFSDHPDYEQVIMRFRNSMFLKCSNRDKVLARELLSGLPLKYWNEKTFRGIARLFFS